MRRDRMGLPDLDLVDLNDVGANRDAVQFLPLFVSDANRAAEILAAVLFEFSRNPGGVRFRAYQVRETLPVRIHAQVALADKVKKYWVIADILQIGQIQTHSRIDQIDPGQRPRIDQIDPRQCRPWRQIR
jgi:hypothetical protein